MQDRIAAAGETIDVVAEMMALTQAIIVRTMFSTDLGATAEVVNRTWPIINRRIGETFWATKLETKLHAAGEPAVRPRPARSSTRSSIASSPTAGSRDATKRTCCRCSSRRATRTRAPA